MNFQKIELEVDEFEGEPIVPPALYEAMKDVGYLTKMYRESALIDENGIDPQLADQMAVAFSQEAWRMILQLAYPECF